MQPNEPTFPRLTIVDYFAAYALTRLINSPWDIKSQKTNDFAYELARAMLQEKIRSVTTQNP